MSADDDLHLLMRGCPLGILTLPVAAAHGFDQRDVARRVGRRQLVRPTRGAFVDADRWNAADATQQHLLRACAVAMTLRDLAALSHVSAAVWFELPLLASPGRRVHLARTGPGQGRSTARQVIHLGYGPGSVIVGPADRSRQEEGQPPGAAFFAVRPVLAALGVAQLLGFQPGVVALDAVLHRRLGTLAEAQHWQGQLAGHPGGRRLARVVAAADGLSESPLETQVRLLLISLGYRVLLQRAIFTRAGEQVGRVDIYLPDLGVIIEVDGAVKYVRSDGAANTAAVVAEKRRESALVDLGYAVVRVEHDDLQHAERLVARITTAARRVDAALLLGGPRGA